MKATGIISALVFAHVAFAQATDSTSASNSASKASAEPTKSSTKPNVAGTSTNEPAATGSSIPISQSQTSNSGNPLIPASASETCTTFLNKLNTDTSLSSCFTPLLTALSAYTSSGSGSASSVTKTLNNLCTSNACSSGTMRAKLTEFKDACSDELTGANPNDIIIKNYDVLYSLIPFKQAVCTKDTNTQDYCVLNIGSGSSSSSTTSNLAARNPGTLSYAANHLSNSVSRKRAQTVLVPNTDTYRNTNLMYLFTSPDMNAGELCVPCTQVILSKYIAFESSTPYALGLKNSPLLGGQSELWAAIQEKCPASFLTEISNSAGVASADDINAASPAMAGSLFTALAGALAAALALV